MAIFALEDVTPGMELAAAIENRQGRVLVSAGVVLSEGMVNALGNWGITHVHVVGPDATFDDGDETASEEVIDAELKVHFRKTDAKDPVVRELFRLAKAAKTVKSEPAQGSSHER